MLKETIITMSAGLVFVVLCTAWFLAMAYPVMVVWGIMPVLDLVWWIPSLVWYLYMLWGIGELVYER